MREGNYILRLSAAERARWDAAAESVGAKSLAEFIRGAVENRIASSEVDELRSRIRRAVAVLDGAPD